MSILLCGSSADLDTVISSVTSYEQLCLSQSDAEICVSPSIAWFEANFLPYFELKTKYYNAKLQLVPVEIKSEGGTADYSSELLGGYIGSAEGFIVIIANEKSLDAVSRDVLAKLVADHRGLPLRQLVSLKRISTEVLSDSERMTRMLWALDSGFEHIEIDEANLLEGWQNREKEGLPRLLEALHSNMWSTMIRKDRESTPPVPSPVPSVCKAPTEISNENEDTEKEGQEDKEKKGGKEEKEGTVEKEKKEDKGGKVGKEAKSGLYTGEVSEEHDDILFGQFADVLSKAREYRDQAVAGDLTDEERRGRAEAVALAMSSMLCGEEDSD